MKVIFSNLVLIAMTSSQSQIRAPTVMGFKLGIRKVKELPENGGYQVFQKDGKLRVQTRVEWVRKQRTQKKTQPDPNGTVIIKEQGYTAFLRPGVGVSVEGGELYAADCGEWGGGIYLIPTNRKSHQKISTRNTLCLERFPTGLYAFQALDHLDFYYSELCKVEFHAGKWSLKAVTTFEEEPSAIERDGDHYVLLMKGSVMTLYPNGTRHDVFLRKPQGDHYWCMTILPNKQIWLGGDGGITCLVPRTDGDYQPFFYIPNKG